VASGLAQSYEQLLLASALVGAGEAGLVPIVYALIPDLFPESRRQTANSIYALASTVTGGLAMALTGQVVGAVEVFRADLPSMFQAVDGWRLAMFAAAAPAPIMALLIGTIAIRRREQKSGATAATPPDAAPAAPALHGTRFLPFFRQHRATFSLFFCAIGLVVFANSAVGTWIVVIYLRVYGQTPQQLGAVLGAISVGATAIGFIASIWVVRRFGPMMGPRLNLRVLVLTALVLAVSFGAMVFATRVEHMYGIQACYTILITTGTMLIPTVLQTLAPGRLRARVAAAQSVIALAAAAAAPPLTGLVSDQFKHLPNGLILSSAIVAVPSLILAALLFFLGERRYELTVEAARAFDQEDPS
jgi:MFS family permease